MILALDLGNSRLSGGFFQDSGHLAVPFEIEGMDDTSQGELAQVFQNLLKDHGIKDSHIAGIGCSSVVPSLDGVLRSVCQDVFQRKVHFLQNHRQSNLVVKYSNPSELGSDRWAGALAASQRFPGKNVIVADLGTATTLDVISGRGEFLGGAIFAGMKTQLRALHDRTAKLPLVDLSMPHNACGTSTSSNLQSGIYYSHLGGLRELITRLKEECFPEESTFVVGTGGLAELFKKSQLFDFYIPNLILEGIFQYTVAQGVLNDR